MAVVYTLYMVHLWLATPNVPRNVASYKTRVNVHLMLHVYGNLYVRQVTNI